MSHFYGKLLWGEHGRAAYEKDAEGNLDIQGIGAYLNSKDGAVIVELFKAEDGGTWCRVKLLKRLGKGCDKVIYCGPVDEVMNCRDTEGEGRVEIEAVTSGLKCSWCGTWFDEKHGHPVACKTCWKQASTIDSSIRKATQNEL